MEGVQGALLAQQLSLVDPLVAAVVALAGIALGILIAHHRTQRVKDSLGGVVLRSILKKANQACIGSDRPRSIARGNALPCPSSAATSLSASSHLRSNEDKVGALAILLALDEVEQLWVGGCQWLVERGNPIRHACHLRLKQQIFPTTPVFEVVWVFGRGIGQGAWMTTAVEPFAA